MMAVGSVFSNLSDGFGEDALARCISVRFGPKLHDCTTQGPERPTKLHTIGPL